MAGDDNQEPERRIVEDRRSGTDTRSDDDKRLLGERRSGLDRRNTVSPAQTSSARPSDAQLALFARRLRRALRSDKARDAFGVARGEYDFAIYPEVLRTVEWIESLAGTAGEGAGQPETLGSRPLRNPLSRRDS